MPSRLAARSPALKTASQTLSKAVPASAPPGQPASSPEPTSPFNARGAAAATFKLSRPAQKGQIRFVVRARQIGPEWIAEPHWSWAGSDMPMDAAPLTTASERFPTRSEAVDAALSRGIRQASAQAPRGSAREEWAASVDELREWAADAMHDVREGDESLPLRGVKVIDIFAGGAGGFGMGLASLGASVELACEIDEEALSVYERNVRPKATYRDVRTLDGSKLSCDIMTMGLLCQAFSPAGDGLGFADPKLADAYASALRLLRDVDAKAIVVECAKQLLANGGGGDGDALVETLLEAGYRVQHRMLDASGFGVPQIRERAFLVATRQGTGALDVDALVGFAFPEPRAAEVCVADIMEFGLPATISASEIAPPPTRRWGRLLLAGNIGGRSAQGYRVYHPSGLGAALTASGGGRARHSGAYAVPGGARALTPREAWRMQGMPEWSTPHESRERAMSHAGNAVALPLARELARSLSARLRR